MNEVKWTCPHCKTENVDYRAEPAFPVCNNCEVALWDFSEYLRLVGMAIRERHGVNMNELIEDTYENRKLAMEQFHSKHPITEAVSALALHQAKFHWEQFGSVPVELGEDAETITAPFLHFPIGTDRHDIYEWFESRYKVSVAADLMYALAP